MITSAQKGLGEVKTQFHTIPGPFLFRDGSTLHNVKLAYESYGTLHPEKNNAILLFHALSASQHAAGLNKAVADTDKRWTEENHLGWWDAYIGPNKALDTNHFHIICVNYLGGCYGSTGPASINPATGQPYAAFFPHMTVSDVVDSQIRLLDHMGINRLHAVIGPSIGGLMAIDLATRYPTRTHLVLPIASGFTTTVLSRLFCFEQVMSIENDPHFQSGNYYNGPSPKYGLALARMISHKSFVHLDTIEHRARRDISSSSDHLTWYNLQSNVESYMLHQGIKFVDRFDANTYLRIMEMWLGFDPIRLANVSGPEELFAGTREAGQHWLVFTINSDFCFYPEEQASLVQLLKQSHVSNMHITVHSDKGHDSFLLEPELFTPHLHYTLHRLFLDD